MSLANSIGTGIADDKGIYPFVPDLIRYYLSEEPILSNVETFRPLVKSHLSHILANLELMVVKTVNESGGSGMLIGPGSTAEQRAQFSEDDLQPAERLYRETNHSIVRDPHVC